MTASIWDIESEADALIKALSWKEDMLIYNDFGEHVWLKPLYQDDKRIGITDCCFADNPCEHHALIAQKETLCKCSCCIEAVNRLSHGRKTDGACSCKDHIKAEQCDCSFCAGWLAQEAKPCG